MVIAVNSECADNIWNWLSKKMTGVQIIGNVNDNGRKVVHSPLGIEYNHY
jgi:hydrogenase maturation factor